MKAQLLLIMMIFSFPVLSQDTLTLEAVVAKALEKNYSILIAKNDVKIAENNTVPGTWGMLPQVHLNAGTNFATNETRQEYSSGLTVDRSGVKSNNLNAAISLNWTLFDGFRMFAVRNRLMEEENLSSVSLKVRIEETVSLLTIGYYNISRLQQQIKALEGSIAISDERLSLVEKKYSLGVVSKVDVLQAKVDRNAQSSLMLDLQTQLAGARADLAKLMGSREEKEFYVKMDIPVDTTLSSGSSDFLAKNSSVLFSQKNVSIQNYYVKEANSFRYPEISLNAAYLFNRSENQAGFALLNQNLGNNVGFTLSMPVFHGFTLRQQYRNSVLNLESSKFALEETKDIIASEHVKVLKEYEHFRKAVALEEENAELASENVKIALERYRLGTSNSLELKTAQQSYEESVARLSDARFGLKSAEIRLLNLRGEILK